MLVAVSTADRFVPALDSNWDSNQVSNKTMLAWMPISADKSSPEKQAHPVAAGLLYRLTVAFPSWAGAILAGYSILLCRFSALKIRPR
jgi:hypothetical protein